jgi:hypothetical protein
MKWKLHVLALANDSEAPITITVTEESQGKDMAPVSPDSLQKYDISTRLRAENSEVPILMAESSQSVEQQLADDFPQYGKLSDAQLE